MQARYWKNTSRENVSGLSAPCGYSNFIDYIHLHCMFTVCLRHQQFNIQPSTSIYTISGFPLLFPSLVSKPCVHLFLSHLNSISFYLSVCLKSKILMLINKLNIMFCPGGRSPGQFQDKVSQWMTPPKGKFSATSHPAPTN